MTDWDESIRRIQFHRKQTFDAGATPGLDDFERPELKSVSSDLVGAPVHLRRGGASRVRDRRPQTGSRQTGPAHPGARTRARGRPRPEQHGRPVRAGASREGRSAVPRRKRPVRGRRRRERLATTATSPCSSRTTRGGRRDREKRGRRRRRRCRHRHHRGQPRHSPPNDTDSDAPADDSPTGETPTDDSSDGAPPIDDVDPVTRARRGRERAPVRRRGRARHPRGRYRGASESDRGTSGALTGDAPTLPTRGRQRPRRRPTSTPAATATPATRTAVTAPSDGRGSFVTPVEATTPTPSPT